MTITITAPTAPATMAQVNYYASLAVQFTRIADPAADEVDVKATATQWALAQNKAAVSAAIDRLKKTVDALPKPKQATVEPGYYMVGSDAYFVTTSKMSGKPYAKKWSLPAGASKATWVYAPGVMNLLAAKATPMTLADAKAFGHAHGYCIRCGRLLTDPVSVENGIGPICQGYWS